MSASVTIDVPLAMLGSRRCFLIVATRRHHGERADHAAREERAREQHAPDLFGEHGHVGHVAAEAAVLLGDEHPCPPEVADLCPDGRVEPRRVLFHRPHVLSWAGILQELTCVGLDDLLGFVGSEIHTLLSFGLAGDLTGRHHAAARCLPSAGGGTLD